MQNTDTDPQLVELHIPGRRRSHLVDGEQTSDLKMSTGLGSWHRSWHEIFMHLHQHTQPEITDADVNTCYVRINVSNS